MSKSLNKLTDIQNALNHNFFEREELVLGVLSAAVAKQHLFVLGTPGTGKSDVLSSFVSAAKLPTPLFSRLLNKMMPPEELLGNYSMTALQKDQFVRNTSGRLPEANFAFLDEIFKCNAATLNSLLGILNERQYQNGDTTMKCPLITCVAASNEIPTNNELAALYDRFLLRYKVEVIQNEDNFIKMLTTTRKDIPEYDLNDLANWNSESQKLTISNELINDGINKIRRAIKEQGVYVSDRTFHKGLTVVKSYSFMNGNTTKVQMEDLEVFRHMAWTDPESRPAINKAVLAIVNPDLDRVIQLDDSVRKMSVDFKAMSVENQTKASTEYFSKARDAADRLSKVNSKSQSVKDAVARAEAFKKYIAYEVMKLPLMK
jgi:MoxR-like ATPase